MGRGYLKKKKMFFVLSRGFIKGSLDQFVSSIVKLEIEIYIHDIIETNSNNCIHQLRISVGNVHCESAARVPYRSY